MSDEENPSTIVSHAANQSASTKSAPLYRQSERSADEAPSIHRMTPTIINMSHERHKHVAKILTSSTGSKRDTRPVGIPMQQMDTCAKDEIEIATTVQPSHKLGRSASPIPSSQIKDTDKEDADSITSEITELRTPDVAKKTPEWSDEEEAGGLPRNESRASRTSRGSRVSRAVRHFFCCGLQIEAPSEDNVSSPRDDFLHSGI